MCIRPLAHLDFEYEISPAISKNNVKLESQNPTLKNKHPVLINVAIKILFTPSSQKVCFVI
jgi:hypothetical protein